VLQAPAAAEHRRATLLLLPAAGCYSSSGAHDYGGVRDRACLRRVGLHEN